MNGILSGKEISEALQDRRIRHVARNVGISHVTIMKIVKNTNYNPTRERGIITLEKLTRYLRSRNVR